MKVSDLIEEIKNAGVRLRPILAHCLNRNSFGAPDGGIAVLTRDDKFG